MFKLTAFQRHWLDFLLAMTEKEIKARYKHAILGFLWVFLNPLLQMVIIGFVFQFFIPVKVDNYFLFLFAGLLPWNFFSYSVTKATPSIVYERALIKKAKFPRESVVLSIILSNFFHFGASLVLLLVALLADKVFFEAYTIGQISLYAARWGWLILIVIWLLAFTVGVSLWTSALNVKYRDINFVVQALMPLWFYATPIVYTLGLLPKFLIPLFYLNPMTAITEQFHKWLLFQPASSNVGTIVSVFITLAICYGGWRTFQKEAHYFDDWI